MDEVGTLFKKKKCSCNRPLPDIHFEQCLKCLGNLGLKPMPVEETSPDDNGFIKYDSGKTMMSLVDPDFISGVAEVLTFGANKYAKNNWQKNTDIDRYKDSTLRHLYAYLNGEMNDPETGMPHLDHVATNIMFLRYFEHGKGGDK